MFDMNTVITITLGELLVVLSIVMGITCAETWFLGYVLGRTHGRKKAELQKQKDEDESE